jgi:hypothetical protein
LPAHRHDNLHGQHLLALLLSSTFSILVLITLVFHLLSTFFL